MWRSMLQQWLVAMMAIGATTLVIAFFLPRHRRLIPLVVPVALGLTCLTLAGIHFADRAEPLPQVLFGVPLSEQLGWQAWWGAALGALVGLSGAWASFEAERRLLRPRRARRSLGPGLPLGQSGLQLPGRTESMSGVARVAEQPVLFLAVSALSATGEELLFRGAMLSDLPWDSPPAVLQLVLLQAVLFGATHLAFGWRTIAAKTLLGLTLGVAVLLGGLILAGVLPHLAYQARVLAQFRPPLSGVVRDRA